MIGMVLIALLSNAPTGVGAAAPESYPYLAIDGASGAVYGYAVKDGTIKIRGISGSLRLDTPGVYGVPGQRVTAILGIVQPTVPEQVDTQAEMEFEENVLPVVMRGLALMRM
jgi:hypothetical protein